MADAPVTQRQLLEQNTDLTRLIYETVGELTQKMNDGFTELKERLASLEGQAEGKAASLQEESAKQGAKTSRWVRASIAVSSSLGLAGLINSLHH